MNLGQIRTKVKNLLNYGPDNAEFNTELDELINNAFGNLAMESEWPFMGHEVDRTLHGRVTNAAGTATNASFNVTTAAPFFLAWMIGQRITISNATTSVVYEVVRVASTTSAYLATAFTGTTGTYTFTADEVFVWLPEDCNYLIEVGAALRQNNSGHGTFQPMFRAEMGKFAFNDDVTGTPDSWTTADAIAIPTPRVGPVFTVGAGAGWAAGTYDFALSYSRNGYHGSLSPVTAQVIPAVTRPTLQLAAITAYVGYQRNLWTRVSATSPWRLFDQELDEGAHANTYAAPLSASSEFDVVNLRFPYTDGQVQRIRIYPLAAADTLIRLRYMRRFFKLIEDTDTPAFFPAQAHEMIAFSVAEFTANKLGQKDTELFCGKKALEYKRAMAAKYLTPGNRDLVKGSAWGVRSVQRSYGLVTWT